MHLPGDDETFIIRSNHSLIAVEESKEEAGHDAIDEGRNIVECTEIAAPLRTEFYAYGTDFHCPIARSCRKNLILK